VLGILVITFLISAFSLANDKNDAAQQLLAKSFQQADLWTNSPVRLTANVTVPIKGKAEASLKYEVSWAGPDKWRAEWSGAGYSQVIVVRDGMRYTYRNLNETPIVILNFEEALGALSGFDPAGPYSPPLRITGVRPSTTSKKIDGIEVRCVHPEQSSASFCIDPVSFLAIRNSGDGATFNYGDYGTLGQSKYPQSIRITISDSEKEIPQLVTEGKVSVERVAAFPANIFLPGANAHPESFPSCADLEKNVVPPSVDNLNIHPHYPDEARRRAETGTVRLHLKLNSEGKLAASSIARGATPELDKAALEMVSKWTYTPYIRCGKGVETEMLYLIRYSLENW